MEAPISCYSNRRHIKRRQEIYEKMPSLSEDSTVNVETKSAKNHGKDSKEDKWPRYIYNC